MTDGKNVSAEVTLRFGDGDYIFRLPIKQIDELQRLCGSGIGDIVARVTAGRPFIQDITETIRLGAIGGGMTPVAALRLVDLYVNSQPIANVDDPASPLLTARAILQAAFFGVSELTEDEPNAGKPAAATETVG